MGHINAKRLYAVDENGRQQPDQTVAIIHPASEESVFTVLGADPNADDGMARSQWLWVRLQNGDLILGVFPQDETYFTCEVDASTPPGL